MKIKQKEKTMKIKQKEKTMKIKQNVSGLLCGFSKDGECLEEAQARIILEAEMSVNKDLSLRLHLAGEAPMVRMSKAPDGKDVLNISVGTYTCSFVVAKNELKDLVYLENTYVTPACDAILRSLKEQILKELSVAIRLE